MAGVKGRSGRKASPLTQEWREFCRDVTASEAVRALIRSKAETDPDYALKIAEAAHGRPPQALDIAHRNEGGPLEFRILDATGADFAFGRGDLPTRSVPLPTEALE